MDTYIITENDDIINIVNDDDNQTVEISEDVVSVNENLDDVKITVLDDTVSVIDSEETVTFTDSPDEVNIVFTEGISQSTHVTQNISEDDVPYKFEEIDFDGENIIYKGWSNGTTETESVWRIQKIEFINGDDDVKKRYANGTHEFLFLWNDRLTYNY